MRLFLSVRKGYHSGECTATDKDVHATFITRTAPVVFVLRSIPHTLSYKSIPDMNRSAYLEMT